MTLLWCDHVVEKESTAAKCLLLRAPQHPEKPGPPTSHNTSVNIGNEIIMFIINHPVIISDVWS